MSEVYLIIPCAYCQTEFQPRQRNSRFCSRNCNDRFHSPRKVKNREKHEHVCAHCSKTYRSNLVASRTKYCSRECSDASNRTGFYDRAGYFHITVNGEKIAEHRHVMQQHLGRTLSRKEVVHHKNGKRDDNRIENLELYSSQVEHMRHHFPRFLSETHAECMQCHQIKLRSDFYIRRIRNTILSMCKACNSLNCKNKAIRQKSDQTTTLE